MLCCAFAPQSPDSSSAVISFSYLLIGRFLLGLGGESIVACASTMITKWFSKSGNVNTALAGYIFVTFVALSMLLFF